VVLFPIFLYNSLVECQLIIFLINYTFNPRIRARLIKELLLGGDLSGLNSFDD